VLLRLVSQTAKRRGCWRTSVPGDYDTLTHAFQFFRRMIVDALPLRPGDVVLAVGCGTGLCFSMLLEKVGPRGRIVGIDASPVMVAAARERMAHAGWRNITLVQSSLIEAQIPLRADAALFCAVHDISCALRRRYEQWWTISAREPG
jgi:cyclopropane fatty-acyl-phospholipid synthase-like methyltransferase